MNGDYNEKLKEMKKLAANIRINTLKSLTNLGFGHYGGSLSIVEILAVLYGGIMNIDPKNPHWEDRDYFVLSKGHAGPALYATLTLKGFFELSEIYTLNQNGTNLPSHPDRLKTKGIDATTGSLGQDISIATGIMVSEALKAIKKLEKEGISVAVIDMFTLNPIDKELIEKYAQKTKKIVTCENHSIHNGLGSAVAEVIAETGSTKLRRIEIKERFGQVGSLEFLMNKYELTSEHIYKAAMELVKS